MSHGINVNDVQHDLNFHNLNGKWIILIIKDCLNEDEINEDL